MFTLKSFAMFLLVGAASGLDLESARACGGCGMSSGGGYYGGGRAAASRKVMGGGANLAHSRPQPMRSAAPAVPVATSRAVGANHSAASRSKMVAATAAKVSAKAAPKKLPYTCPMHPQIQWTSAVDCPICGMKLKLKGAKKSAQGEMTMETEHAGMEGMGEGDQSMGDMSGMDDTMMCCPGCMGMGGMSGMGGGNGSTKASSKGTSRRGSMGAMAGMGCGC